MIIIDRQKIDELVPRGLQNLRTLAEKDKEFFGANDELTLMNLNTRSILAETLGSDKIIVTDEEATVLEQWGLR